MTGFQERSPEAISSSSSSMREVNWTSTISGKCDTSRSLTISPSSVGVSFRSALVT
jgi:hypothetical protein